jgi:hypothetical protein
VSILESRLQGDLLWPADDEYDVARTVWNRAIDRRPSFIVRAVDAEDVVAAVDFARAQNLSVAVRSGGHSNAGFGTCDDGLLLDLSRLNRIDIDPVTRRARIEPGLRWAEVAAAAHPYGLALTSGNSGSVGVGGLLLGGGIGWMVRKYGLALDRLRAVELVTAKGHFVRASATEHADLFWGLRGGGRWSSTPAARSSAGCSSSMPHKSRATSVLRRHLRSVLPAFVRFVRAAPDELTTDSLIVLAPPAPFIPVLWHGRPVMAIMVCYTGDVVEGERVIAPLWRVAQAHRGYCRGDTVSDVQAHRTAVGRTSPRKRTELLSAHTGPRRTRGADAAGAHACFRRVYG